MGESVEEKMLDKKVRRRMYFKKMRQIYRSEEKQERLYLINKIHELERVAIPLQERARVREVDEDGETRTMLAWKDIALVMQEDVQLAVKNQMGLKSQVEDVKQLIWRMKNWVATNSVIRNALDCRVPTWRNVTLLAHPSSRKLGKEWITQQLYYNTDSIFHQYGFPAVDSGEFIDWDSQTISATSGDYTIYRRQAETQDTLDEAVSHIDQTLLSVQGAYLRQKQEHASSTVVEVEGNTKQFALVTPRREFVNLLCGEFFSPGRCVFVLQQILDDEACPHAKFHQRNRMFWHDLQELPGGRTVVRSLAIHSLCFANEEDDDSNLLNGQKSRVFDVNVAGCPYMNSRQPRFPSW
ncbi:unnamed protein product [Aphanomyces euteiches]